MFGRPTPTWQFCGCWYTIDVLQQNSFPYPVRYLPQVDLKAHTTIKSTVSRTTLTQTFVNPSKDTARENVKYTFPLYDGVSVVAFKCEIGDRVIHGVVKPREKAKAEYDQAVKEGKTAALLEQSKSASDTFTTSIGKIPPASQAIVHITYLGELKHDAQADGIRFCIPTVIAPRYASADAINLGDLPSSLSSIVNLGKVDITVDVEMPSESKIQSLQSPSHPVTITLGRTSVAAENVFQPNFASAAYETRSDSNGVHFSQDFVLIVKATNQDLPCALLETHPDFPNHRVIMTSLVPKFNIPNNNPEIVFIIDRSGSMEENIETLKAALRVFLKSLPVGIKFNLCSFGSGHSFMWKKSQTYDASSLDKALKYVDTIRADMGGTEMLAPVRATVANRFKDTETEILLLTDGEIWDQQNLFDFINKVVEKDPIRFFTLGIGNNVSHSLIEGIARAGNGFAQSVGINEQMDRKVVRMLKGALTPHVKDYTLEVEYDQAEDDEYDIVEKSNDIPTATLPVRSKETDEKPKSGQPISLFDSNFKEQDIPSSVHNEANLPPLTPPKILQAPYKIPALYPFSRTSVYLLLSPETNPRTPKSVTLRGTSNHGPLSLSIPVENVGRGTAFHQLAVRKLTLELEEGRGWVYHAKDAKGKLVLEQHESKREAIIEREAVRLGLKFQVGGKYCSFVAIEGDGISGKMADIVDTSPDQAQAAAPPAYSPGYPTASPFSAGSLPFIGARFASFSANPTGSLPPAAPRMQQHQQLMSMNIDQVAARGESLESLQDRSDELSASAASFKRGAVKSKSRGLSGGFGSLFGGGGGGGLFTSRSSHSMSRGAPGQAEESFFGSAAPAAAPAAAVPFALGPQPTGHAQASLFASPPPPPPPASRKGTKLHSASLFSRPQGQQAQAQQPENKVHAVISQQLFEGSWDWTPAILSTMGISDADVDRLDWAAILGADSAAIDKSNARIRKIIITLAVAAYLQRRLGAEKETWELVYEKALTWVRAAVAEVGGNASKPDSERLAHLALLFP